MTENFCNSKILFVFSRLELGGAERQGFLLAKYLKDQYAAKVEVVALQGKPGRLAELCQEAGIPCRSLDAGNMITKLDWLRALFYFVANLNKTSPDLLVSYTTRANIISALSWRVVGARGFIWNQADEGLGMKRTLISKLAVALTPRFVSNSTGGSLFLQKSYAVPSKMISVIYNGVELPPPVTSRIDWRKSLNISEDDIVACMVANISRFKDHVTLLKAWRKVLDASTQRPVLLLAGRFDGTEKELMQLTNDLRLGAEVRFLGPVDDVSGLLNASDLFVYSSISEGLPNGVLEAMAAGLPVIGTDIPGIREALGVNEKKYLSPIGDSDGLAQAVQKVIGSPELSRCYGDTLQQRARENFSLSTLYEISVKVLRECI